MKYINDTIYQQETVYNIKYLFESWTTLNMMFRYISICKCS